MTLCRCVAVFVRYFVMQKAHNQQDDRRAARATQRHDKKLLSDVTRPNGRCGSSSRARKMQKAGKGEVGA